eukprot:TRINITY_DN935_c0_g1_i5.p1 TRINITY_DN935_c0_g1~~TRINITY_DN935_c0_g1_i5.p1  ORF type:complete len:442 (-),score=77.15 TRINITY_DN935_c0_g1_i5:1355-2680(-)
MASTTKSQPVSEKQEQLEQFMQQYNQETHGKMRDLMEKKDDQQEGDGKAGVPQSEKASETQAVVAGMVPNPSLPGKLDDTKQALSGLKATPPASTSTATPDSETKAASVSQITTKDTASPATPAPAPAPAATPVQAPKAVVTPVTTAAPKQTPTPAPAPKTEPQPAPKTVPQPAPKTAPQPAPKAATPESKPVPEKSKAAAPAPVPVLAAAPTETVGSESSSAKDESKKQAQNATPVATVVTPVAAVVEQKPKEAPEKPKDAVVAAGPKAGADKPNRFVRAISNAFRISGKDQVQTPTPQVESPQKPVVVTENVKPVPKVDPIELLKKDGALQETIMKLLVTPQFQDKVNALKLEQKGEQIGTGIADSCFGRKVEKKQVEAKSVLGEGKVQELVDKNVHIEELKPIVTPLVKGMIGPIEERIEENLQVTFWQAWRMTGCRK